jgi:hypothetical protein
VEGAPAGLTKPVADGIVRLSAGGVVVSTWRVRLTRHAEDDALASLIIASKQNCQRRIGSRGLIDAATFAG